MHNRMCWTLQGLRMLDTSRRSGHPNAAEWLLQTTAWTETAVGRLQDRNPMWSMQQWLIPLLQKEQQQVLLIQHAVVVVAVLLRLQQMLLLQKGVLVMLTSQVLQTASLQQQQQQLGVSRPKRQRCSGHMQQQQH